MSQVRITYWNADGRYRRKKGKITGELPRHLLNGADKQAHSLTESPVFTQSTDPLYLKVPAVNLNWADLTGGAESEPVPVPRPPLKSEGLAVLVEEGAIWPVSPVPYTDTIARQEEQAETHAEALALARAREARASGGDGLLKFGFAVGIVAVLILVLIIGLVVIDSRFGGSDVPPPAAANTNIAIHRSPVEPLCPICVETAVNVMSSGVKKLW